VRRRVNLRQIEVFKAVMEHGTVSAAATALHVSQPAMSKSLAQLEADTALRLFDRVKGRLAPTEQGMLLYSEIDRIFGGVQQVENAIDALHRQVNGRLLVGVMPALSGGFLQHLVTRFLQARPATYVEVHVRSSEWIMAGLVGHRLDVGLLSARMQSPYVTSEALLGRDLVCIMPRGHALSQKSVIVPADLADVAYVSLEPEGATGQQILGMLAEHGVTPSVSLVTNLSSTLCRFVASGLGVALIHPLAIGAEEALVVRAFEPRTTSGFSLCYDGTSRNVRLVESFASATRETAAMMLAETSDAQRRPSETAQDR
jgi:DNA-binding transcriptional LysR family regulator